MRNLLLSTIAVAVLAGAAQADIYTDSAGDVFTGAGGGILDILSVEVTNDASNLYFTFNVGGSIAAADWGNYMVMLDTVAGGDTVGNGWGRPIGFASGGDHWLGSWVNGGGGAEIRTWNGSGWDLNEASYNAAPENDVGTLINSETSFTIRASLADLGLDVGDKVIFDAYSSGADFSPGALDALANPGITIGDWGNYYQTPSSGQGGALSYTIVPAPASVALVGLGGLLAGRRRR
jgi:hypothetical protein